MRNKLHKKRLSLISDIIIFIFLICAFNFSKGIFLKDNFNTLSLSNVDIEDEILIRASNIKDKYKVNVIYGEDTSHICTKINANILNDNNIINNNLKSIETTLEKYPDKYYSKKNKMEIYLVDTFNDNNIALASRNNLNEFKIYLSNNKNYERSFHHENFHIFEYGQDNVIFNNWNEYNPKDFNYEKDIKKLNAKYVFDLDNNPYFVSKYSKTNEKEDRAEIFSEIMIYTDKPNFLTDKSNLNKKANYLIDILNSEFGSNNYWNR